MLNRRNAIFKTKPYYGGDFLFGDTIEIDNSNVIMKRNRLFFKAFYSISIPIANIVNVQILRKNGGAEILVESYSKNLFISRGYSYSSACRIKELIMQ